MNDIIFEGSIVLERLAEIGKVEDFFDAVDSDNFGKAQSLMQEAGLDLETIQTVLEKMSDSN